MFEKPQIPDPPNLALMHIDEVEGLINCAILQLDLIGLDPQAASGETYTQSLVRTQARDILSSAIKKLKEWKLTTD